MTGAILTTECDPEDGSWIGFDHEYPGRRCLTRITNGILIQDFPEAFMTASSS